MTIYLDYAATTPVDPRVAAVMAEALSSPAQQGNPASATHRPGRAAAGIVDVSRQAVATRIRCIPAQIRTKAVAAGAVPPMWC